MQTWGAIFAGAVAVSVACWVWGLWRDHRDRAKVKRLTAFLYQVRNRHGAERRAVGK
jgi:hypothetical protein